MPPAIADRVANAVSRLDAWLQTMRNARGYTGPVAHWWESSLLYCGPMIDWRYEGIICGYLTLYRRTQDGGYLDRAIQAGEDILDAQLPDGRYKNSSFQQGPMEGGTPHESAVDVGLLDLAQELRRLGDDRWRQYFVTAERNIQSYQIGKLWNGQGFIDQSWNPVTVPNKNATLIEALILYEALSGQDMSPYIDGAIEVVLNSQEKSGPRPGAIVHQGTGHHRLAIGIYNARTICGILKAYERQQRDDLLDCAQASLSFLKGLATPLGNQFGRYPDGRPIANPKMIAGSGDVLRAMSFGRSLGLVEQTALEDQITLLLDAQTPAGDFPTARGFARRGAHTDFYGPPDFRDLLPVVGWCDKAFRSLAIFIEYLISGSIHDVNISCTWKNKRCIYHQDQSNISLIQEKEKRTLYHLTKSHRYPETYRL